MDEIDEIDEIIDLYLNGEYDIPSYKELSDNEYYFSHSGYFDCKEVE